MYACMRQRSVEIVNDASIKLMIITVREGSERKKRNVKMCMWRKGHLVQLFSAWQSARSKQIKIVNLFYFRWTLMMAKQSRFVQSTHNHDEHKCKCAKGA